MTDDRQRATAMNLRQTLLGLGLLLALGLAATGCAKGTYLEVRVTGSDLPDIYALRVALTLTPPTDAGGSAIDTIDTGAVIKLPTSMAFQLDTETGSLQVAVTALDQTGRQVGAASTTTTIKRAQTWTVVLNLAPP